MVFKNSKWSLGAERLSRRNLMKGAAVAAGGLAAAQLPGVTGQAEAAFAPTTVVPSYVKPSIPGVVTRSILTVGDLPALNGYRLVGIGDGLGAFDNGDGTFTLLMHHELRATTGITRAHGSIGAFVSRWKIDSETLTVYEGQDFTRSANWVYKYDPAARKFVPGTTAWDRFCSADLPAPSALFYNGLGTTEQVFLGGEETNEGRAWAHVATGPNTGQSWQLPRLGKMAWENVVACPHSKAKTIVFCMDDGALATAPIAANNPSEVTLYIGDKQSDGNAVEKAGLQNGKLYGLVLKRGGTLVTEESNQYGLGDATTGFVRSARFELVELGDQGDVSALSGVQLSQDCIDHDVFRTQRCEDGAWDPRPASGNNYYFVTTANLTSNSRLWRIRFDNIDRPENGGTIEILVNASAGRMFDNICVDTLGRVLIQEDTGNDPYVSKIRVYGISSGRLIEVAQHDPELFRPGINPAKFMTQDEESSGIIDMAHIMGEGWFLGFAQIHKAYPDPELVEYGQLFAMYVDPAIR